VKLTNKLHLAQKFRMHHIHLHSTLFFWLVA